MSSTGKTLLSPKTILRPGETRYNLPGQQALTYRGAPYRSVLPRMLARLPLQPVSQGDEIARPLAHVNPADHQDWAIALLHAWALVLDVLTFYQERITNEGYLRTATEERSIVALARMLGYEARPDLAASANLVFTVTKQPDEPHQQAFIPASVAVQSVASPERTAQIFETSAPFTARSEWNAFYPARLQDVSWRRDIGLDTSTLRLAGAQTGLSAGDMVLVVGDAELKPELSAAPRYLAAKVEAVELAPALNRTIVHLDPASVPNRDYHRNRGHAATIHKPRVYALRQRTALFGYRATGLFVQQAREDKWRPQGIGLPPVAVHGAVANRAGMHFVATAQGIFRSTDGGAYWQHMPIGLMTKNVHALALTEDDQLLAGSDEGGIYFSKDNGENWIVLSDEAAEAPPRGLRKWWPKLFACPSLPKTVVRALASYRAGRRNYFVAGTDMGIFRSGDGGQSWRPTNQSLPKLDPKTGFSETAVSALSVVNGRRLFAGTGAGIFHIKNRNWPSVRPAIFLGMLLGAVVAGLGLYNQAQPAVGQSGLLDQLLTWYVRLINSVRAALVGDTLVFTLLITLAVLCALAVRWLSVRYLDLLEQIDTPTHALLTTPDGQIYAGTELGLFQAVRHSGWWSRLLARGRPIMAWRAVSHGLETPLFIFDEALKPDLEDGGLSVDLKAALNERQIWLPEDAQLSVIAAGVQWRIVTAAGAAIYDVQRLDHLLLLYQGPIKPLFSADLELQTDLDRARLSATVRQLFADHLIELPPATRLYIAELGRHWQLLNPKNVPLIELRRVADRLIVYTTAAVQALTQDEEGRLLAGAASGSVYSATVTPERTTWEMAAEGLRLSELTALTRIGDNFYATGSAAVDTIEKQWAASQLEQNQIDLEQISPTLGPESWLVLHQPAEPRSAAYRVASNAPVDSLDFVTAGRFSRLVVAGSGLQDDFERDLSEVWGNHEPLAWYDDRPVQGVVIPLDRYVPGLTTGQQLILRGKPMRARVQEMGLRLRAVDSLETTALKKDESLQIVACREIPGSEALRLRLRNDNGFVGDVVDGRGKEIEAGYNQMILIPARDDDAAQNQLLTLAQVEATADQTTLFLQQALATVYDRSTIVFQANLAPATHGASVRDEVLGSSDGRVIFPLFRLSQGPLTFLPAATPRGSTSELKVSVNEITWDAQPTLFGLARNARAYIMRQDARGNTAIIFGDGQQGARLPTSDEQVKATYRIGAGPEGNVPADSLTQLQTRLANIAAVTNPFPASGGIARQSRQDVRKKAPLMARSSERIVSLRDYQDFTRAFSGIGKALAQPLWAGGESIIHITVADRDGGAVSAQSALYRNLAAAIEGQRAGTNPRVQVDSFEAVYFDVHATLYITAAQVERGEAIIAAAARALNEAFSFASREFAQAVAAAEVIASLQGADAAIINVELRRFALADSAARGCLFSVDSQFVNEVDRGALPEALRAEFQSQDRPLADEATVSMEEAGSKWKIVDASTEYLIKNEDQTLNVYAADSPAADGQPLAQPPAPIPAQSARWACGRIHPAQLLRVNAKGEHGIDLILEIVP